VKEDPGEMAALVAGLPGTEKDRLLMLVARHQAARARMELLRGVRGDPDQERSARPRLLVDLRDLARRDGRAGEFERRFAALREEHLRKPSLIARFDRAGLNVGGVRPGAR
jgi:hypothetical protein